MPQRPWLEIRKPLTPGRAFGLKLLSFLIPLAVWSALSYLPLPFMPYVAVTEAGQSEFLTPGMLVKRSEFEDENARLAGRGAAEAAGTPSMPLYLPAPHKVAIALVTGFTTPPARADGVWLHESLWASIVVIFWGFLLSAAIGVPLGILAGTFAAIGRLVEPVVDFVRYMPAPAFGALVVAVFGIYAAPKIAIIFIGTFFQMVLVVANTARGLDISLIEAGQTLGASRRTTLSHVVIPGILPQLYDDMRVLLGWAWTYLIVAELIGAASGISYFINQQGRFSQYDKVYAGILIIGLIGFFTDQALIRLKPVLMPWTAPARGPGRDAAAEDEGGIGVARSGGARSGGGADG